MLHISGKVEKMNAMNVDTYQNYHSYLVSPQSSIHSGLDTPHVRMTLLGADGPNAFHDIDAYFLTELFEFALSTKQNGAASLPFLQGYKLMHAWWLADLGLLNLAQRYCESIASAVKGYTKGSPYLHRQLLESIREFNEVCEVTSGHSLGYVDLGYGMHGLYTDYMIFY